MGGKYDPLVEALCGDLSTENSNVACECPKCEKQKLYVDRDRGVFLCFACEWSGRALDLVAQMHGLSPRTAKAFLHRYTDKARGVTEDNLKDVMRRIYERPIPEGKRVASVKLPAGAVPVSGTMGERYLKSRGFNRSLTKSYRLMYVPPNYKKGTYEPAANHVIFPCFTGNNVLEFWTSRAAYDPVERGPKSTGPSGISKKAVVYGLKEFQPYKGDGRLILVEGPLDCLSLDRNGCALLGKHLSDMQIQRLLKAGHTGIIVCLDAEERRASWEAAARINRWDEDIEVYVGNTAPYKDAAEALADSVDPVRLIRESAIRFTEGRYRKETVR